MTSMLWASVVISAIVGVLHAGYVYGLVVGYAESGGRARAYYYAAWTLGLWLLFGPYVLVLWAISLLLYAVARPFRWRM